MIFFDLNEEKRETKKLSKHSKEIIKLVSFDEIELIVDFYSISMDKSVNKNIDVFQTIGFSQPKWHNNVKYLNVFFHFCLVKCYWNKKAYKNIGGGWIDYNISKESEQHNQTDCDEDVDSSGGGGGGGKNKRWYITKYQWTERAPNKRHFTVEWSSDGHEKPMS